MSHREASAVYKHVHSGHSRIMKQARVCGEPQVQQTGAGYTGQFGNGRGSVSRDELCPQECTDAEALQTGMMFTEARGCSQTNITPVQREILHWNKLNEFLPRSIQTGCTKRESPKKDHGVTCEHQALQNRCGQSMVLKRGEALPSGQRQRQDNHPV